MGKEGKEWSFNSGIMDTVMWKWLLIQENEEKKPIHPRKIRRAVNEFEKLGRWLSLKFKLAQTNQVNKNLRINKKPVEGNTRKREPERNRRKN